MIESQVAEKVRLKKMVCTTKGSMREMRKPELVEKARKDMGMTEGQLKKETVTSLSERLRSQKGVTDMMIDPLAKTSKGLESLVKDELKQECLLRDIHVPEGKDCTRPKIIALIKDDVATRAETEQRSFSRVKHSQDLDVSFQECSDARMDEDFAPPSRREE